MGNDATVPQNDREYIIQISGNVEKLTERIVDLTVAIKEMQTNEIKPLYKKVDNVEAWQNRFDGSWKAIIAISTFLTIIATALGIIAYFSK